MDRPRPDHRPLALVGRGLLGAVVGGCLSLAVTAVVLPRVYRSVGTVVFPLPASNQSATAGLAALVGLGTEVPTDSSFPLDTYVAVLSSNLAMEAAARACGIDQLYEAPNNEVLLGWMHDHVLVELRADRILVVQALVPGTPEIRGLGDVTDRAGSRRRDAVYRETSADLVRRIVDQMAEISENIQLDRAKARLEQVTERAAAEREVLDQLQTEMAAEQSRLGTADLITYAGELTKAMVAAKSELSGLDAELAETRRRQQVGQQQIDRLLGELGDLPSDVPLLSAQREAYLSALEERDRLKAQYGPENAELLAAERELTARQKALRAAGERARAGLLPEMLELRATEQSLLARRETLSGVVAKYERYLKSVPTGASRLAMLQGELEGQRSLVTALQGELLSAQRDYEQYSVQWSWLDEPRVPLYKDSPRLKSSLMMGLLVGLGFGFWPLAAMAYGQLFSTPEPSGQDAT